MERILVMIVLVWLFTAIGFLAGYRSGHYKGRRCGSRGATGSSPLDEKAICKKFLKICKRKY